MKKPFSSKAKRSILSFLIAPVLLVLLFIAVVYGANQTTLNQVIAESTKSINIVDGSGITVDTPSIAFDQFTFSFDPGDSSGVLGTASEKIRVSNPTITETWSVAIAATGGNTTTWTDGGTENYPYNNAIVDDGSLTVNPSTGTIDPASGCTTTSITTGTSDTFVQNTLDSIDIISASAGADTLCYWDLTGVSLTQRIPASQPTGSYSIGMTLSFL